MKKIKTEKRTIIGKVKSISPERKFDGDVVVNVDLEIPGQEPRLFVDVAFWGLEAIAILRGKYLDEEKNVWVDTKTPVKLGTRLRVTGQFRMKSWKPTKSKALGKSVKKGYLPVYSHSQVVVRALPPL